MANLSIAQKQMAPMTTIIRTPIKAESIAIPLCRDGPVHHFTMHSTMESPALHSILRTIDAVDNFLAVREGISLSGCEPALALRPGSTRLLMAESASTRKPACC
jgi:hypothetical protein